MGRVTCLEENQRATVRICVLRRACVWYEVLGLWRESVSAEMRWVWTLCAICAGSLWWRTDYDCRIICVSQVLFMVEQVSVMQDGSGSLRQIFGWGEPTSVLESLVQHWLYLIQEKCLLWCLPMCPGMCLLVRGYVCALWEEAEC